VIACSNKKRVPFAVALRSEAPNALSMEQGLELQGTLLTGVAFMAKSVRCAQSDRGKYQSGI